MDALSIVSQLLLWAAVLTIVFLLLGVLRQIALIKWRLEELSAVTPSRIGRDGLKPGARAPEFTLESVEGTAWSLADFAGQTRLLVFVQPGCGPCSELVPALNSLQQKGDVGVVAISTGDQNENRAWADQHGVRFPVLVQDRRQLSRGYEVFATPFAFLVDERGVIAAKGIVNDASHIGFLLAGTQNGDGQNRKGKRPWATR